MVSQRKAGVVLGYINLIVKNLVYLAYTPMLLAFVGQDDYGVFQTVNSFLITFSLLTFGFSGAYIRFYTKFAVDGKEDDIRQLNGVYLVFYLIIILIVLASSVYFAENVNLLFSKSFTKSQIELASQLMMIMGVNIASTLFSTVLDSYILAHEKFMFQQSRLLFMNLATPVIALTLLYFGLGAVGVALAQLTVNFTLLVLNARYAIGKLGMRFAFRGFNFSLFKTVAGFSAWLFVYQICEIVDQSVPNVLLGATVGAAAVAVFSVAVSVRQVFFSLSTTMSSVFTPLINRIVAESDDNDALTLLMTRVGRYQMMLFFLFYGGFAVVGRFFISVWAGEEFQDAYWLILFMTLPISIPLSQNTGIEIQRAKNKHQVGSIIYACMAIVNVVFTLLASSYFTYWAPAIAYVISIVLGNGLFMNWYYQNRIGIDIIHFWKKNCEIVGVAIVSILLILSGTAFVPVQNWITFIAWGTCYVAIYILMLWKFVLSLEEKDQLKSRVFTLGTAFINRR